MFGHDRGRLCDANASTSSNSARKRLDDSGAARTPTTRASVIRIAKKADGLHVRLLLTRCHFTVKPSSHRKITQTSGYVSLSGPLTVIVHSEVVFGDPSVSVAPHSQDFLWWGAQ